MSRVKSILRGSGIAASEDDAIARTRRARSRAPGGTSIVSRADATGLALGPRKNPFPVLQSVATVASLPPSRETSSVLGNQIGSSAHRHSIGEIEHGITPRRNLDYHVGFPKGIPVRWKRFLPSWRRRTSKVCMPLMLSTRPTTGKPRARTSQSSFHSLNRFRHTLLQRCSPCQDLHAPLMAQKDGVRFDKSLVDEPNA